jgi:hypothetical protein
LSFATATDGMPTAPRRRAEDFRERGGKRSAREIGLAAGRVRVDDGDRPRWKRLFGGGRHGAEQPRTATTRNLGVDEREARDGS